MSLSSDLETEVKATLRTKWEEQETKSVPAPKELRLDANHAKKIDKATVLYADLDGSTNMVDEYIWWFAAEMYETYLRCASKIIRSEGGAITAYDGDRVMAVFVGDYKNSSAVSAALKINYAVEKIIRPAIKAQYPKDTFLLKHVIGIDTSILRAARIGVRGENDIVWVGRAANYAAKLCSLSETPLWITKAVYDVMNNDAKYSNGQTSGTNMWKRRYWKTMGDQEIYCSTWRRSF